MLVPTTDDNEYKLEAEKLYSIIMLLRNNPNLETTKPRPKRATAVLSHARNVL
jgi:hypothetical protein